MSAHIENIETINRPKTLDINNHAKVNDEKSLPHNIEAEAELLGAILVDNRILEDIDHRLLGEHFYEKINGKIFSAIQHFHNKGLSATPLTLKHYFDNDPDMTDLGGGEFLANLAVSSLGITDPASLSNNIYDLYLSRKLASIGCDIINDVHSANFEESAISLIEKAEAKLFNLSEHGATSSIADFSSAMKIALNNAEIARNSPDSLAGVTTGLTDLDSKLGGMRKSDLLILAGRPSMGKTALATNIAYNACVSIAKEDKKKPDEKPRSVAFFSLEMSMEQLATRIISSECKISSHRMMQGKLNDDEFSTLAKKSANLNDMRLFIDDTPALSISALRARARRLKRRENLGLIVIDYLQLIRGSASVSMNSRVMEISEITQGLKAMAKELDVPVLALSQLSRAVEARDDKRPQLADLRDSGTIEQDADVVMFIYREEYYIARSKPNENEAELFHKWQEKMARIHALADVIVAKQRNGPIGNITLHFEQDITKFGNAAISVEME